MSFSETKIGGKTVFDGRVVKLDVDEVRLDDGSLSVRECVHHSGGAAVLYVENGKVMLVKQFRYAYGKEIYEIPAGKLEKGEDPAVAAARELEEETGYRAGAVEHWADIYPTPGYTDEIIRVYRAKDCKFTHKHPDDGEFIKCGFVPLDEVMGMIERGDICDAKTVIAVYKYLLSSAPFVQ